MWALSLVPEAFLRFVLIGLAHTLYRVRVVGRSNIPSEGGALLVPNHVTFADGLFVIASTDRPVRFMIYADYFNRPLTGPILRSMKAIPISPSGGPKMILQAFREAGRALDAGELVCLFPEGQLTRTGVMTPFQRGLERIVKGRTTPIIPVHLDRLSNSIFSPASHRRIPKQVPYPVTFRSASRCRPDVPSAPDPADDSRARHRGVELPQGGSPAACTTVSSGRRGGTRSPGVRRPLDAQGFVHQGPGRLDRDRAGIAGTMGGSG